jgi:hypothetical protein
VIQRDESMANLNQFARADENAHVLTDERAGGLSRYRRRRAPTTSASASNQPHSQEAEPRAGKSTGAPFNPSHQTTSSPFVSTDPTSRPDSLA